MAPTSRRWTSRQQGGALGFLRSCPHVARLEASEWLRDFGEERERGQVTAALPANAVFFGVFCPVAIRGIARKKNHMGTQQEPAIDRIMTKKNKTTAEKQLAGVL